MSTGDYGLLREQNKKMQDVFQQRLAEPQWDVLWVWIMNFCRENEALSPRCICQPPFFC
jgi:hypothetical protein